MIKEVKIKSNVRDEDLQSGYIVYEVDYDENEVESIPDKPVIENRQEGYFPGQGYTYHNKRTLKVVSDTKENALKLIKRVYDQETQGEAYRKRITDKDIAHVMETGISTNFYEKEPFVQGQFCSELGCHECNGKYVAWFSF